MFYIVYEDQIIEERERHPVRHDLRQLVQTRRLDPDRIRVIKGHETYFRPFPVNAPDSLSVPEAAQELRVSTTTIYSLLHKGRLERAYKNLNRKHTYITRRSLNQEKRLRTNRKAKS
jgi:excisionase family DNA binding protein